ncbi:MAG: alpha-amylase family glycosyl hydrolase [Pseudomonadota bacterium]
MNQYLKALSAGAAVLALLSCSESEPVDAHELAIEQELSTEQPQAEAELYYHIFVRSFADSNGDGHGDLQGIIDKLDYLQSLGVTGILLTPLYPSAFYHNYFADDFYGIDEEFGTMDTYAALVSSLHDRGMTLILDQEIQYVSGNHEWATDSAGNPESSFDPFVLYADDDNNEPIGTLFGITDFQVWPNQTQQIYTVDMLTDETRAYFIDYLFFWMDPNGDGDFSDGADGFRIDHMMDDLDNAGVLTGLFKEFWVPIFDRLRATNPNIFIVAEQADWGYGEAFVDQGEADMVFGFAIRDSLLKLDASAFATAMSTTNDVLGTEHDQFVFIENHDTDRFTSLQKDVEVQKFAASASMLLGWTPILYYGQELGMMGHKIEGDLDTDLMGSQHDVRDIPVREAMRWDADAPGDRAQWYMEDPDAYKQPSPNDETSGIWVSQQDGVDGSLLEHYRALSQLRRDVPTLAGKQTSVVYENDDVVVLERSAPGLTNAYVVMNFADKQRDLYADFLFTEGVRLNTANGSVEFTDANLSLGAYAVVVLSRTAE